MATKRQSAKAKPHTRRGVKTFWSGTISFGLVNVPVHLFPANRNISVSLRMLDADGTPLSRRFHCPEHGRDVHPEHIIRGYRLDDEQYVIIRDEELEAIEPKKSREIDLRRFVDLGEVSPMLFDRAYYLTPGGDSNKAYRLLAAVMEKSRKAGIATFVMRDREYLIAILAENGILRAQTMRFADEVRTPEMVGLPEISPPPVKDVKRIEKLIQEHRDDQLDIDLLKDEYAEQVRKLAESKRKNKRNVVRTHAAQQEEEEVDADDAPAIDLLESIRRSLQQENGSTAHRTRHQKSRKESKEDAPSSPHAGNRNGHLQAKSKEELYEQAKQMDIPGRSKLSKAELIQAISKVASQQ